MLNLNFLNQLIYMNLNNCNTPIILIFIPKFINYCLLSISFTHFIIRFIDLIQLNINLFIVHSFFSFCHPQVIKIIVNIY
jgi:hypothetical protein